MKVYNTAEEFIRDEYEEFKNPLQSINVEGHHAVWMMEEYAKQKVEEARKEMKAENMRTFGRAYNHL